MKRYFGLLIILLIFLILIILLLFREAPSANHPSARKNNSQSTTRPSKVINQVPLEPPLDRPQVRITKKKFGLFVRPQNSPVKPERFSGYHTGVDFEIFPEELNQAVSVSAVCSGSLRRKGIIGLWWPGDSRMLA